MIDSESDFEILDQPRIEPAQQFVGLPAGRTDNAVPEGQSISSEAKENSRKSFLQFYEAASSTPELRQQKRKRRKKLSTTEGKATIATIDQMAQRQLQKTRGKVDATTSPFSVKYRVNEEKIPFVAADGCGHLVEFWAYEAALMAQGWQAQLLQDIDLHLLRAVAAIARRQLALEITGGEQKPVSRPIEDSSPHESYFMALKSGIKASQNDLSSMIAALIGQTEQVQSPERVEFAARIGIPAFVSTGSGNVMLLRDIERHLLLIVAAVRQHVRAMKISSYTRGEISSGKRLDLRALQLHIER